VAKDEFEDVDEELVDEDAEDGEDDDDEDVDLDLDDDLGLDDIPVVADDDEELDLEDDDDDAADDDDDDDAAVATDEAEESLDVLLAREQGEDDTLVRLDDEPRDGLVSVTTPIGADEFTCRSCFLVKRRAQLADEKKMICFDCA
jgi:Domain of unknown function (DUF4193)